MDHEIIKINDNTWRIEDGGVRMFLLAGTEKALLIDSGMNVHNAKDIAEGLTSLPLYLINTHADRDHIGSNDQFDSFFMHPAEVPNYERAGGKGQIIPVEEGDIIDLGERELKIIHIPGHTPGSIGILDVKARVLISGDPVQENGKIFMFGPARSMEDYIKSLEHLEDLRDEFDEIWPSHSDIPVSPGTIKKLHDGAIDVLQGKVKGTPMEMHGNKITAYDLGFSTLLCE